MRGEIFSYLDDCLEQFDEPFRQRDVEKALSGDRLTPRDLGALLSEEALPFLEPMARKSALLTQRNFGKAVLLYAPIYLSDYCSSPCTYCSFNCQNKMPRSRLGKEELRREAEYLAQRGIQHVLVLTGCSQKHSPPDWIAERLEILRDYFACVGLEIFSLDRAGYEDLGRAGAEEMTIYQETYDRELYKVYHPSGPKSVYDERIAAPEAACQAGYRSVNQGVLLGLAPWRRDFFTAACHAVWLASRYPGTDVALSFPRIRPAAGYHVPYPVEDRDLVQAMLAWRLFMPRGGLSLSTRESADLRRHLIPLGVTRLSAGSSTAVGGYVLNNKKGQFAVSDESSIEATAAMLKEIGYQPVYRDWQSPVGSVGPISPERGEVVSL
ncbi:MAG: 2-iminoacetate synthase ThiH [Spirochaetales bacterium]|nr:2-iminoacetate synthase ThiH [Spirochaetales bacterium]